MLAQRYQKNMLKCNKNNIYIYIYVNKSMFLTSNIRV